MSFLLEVRCNLLDGNLCVPAGLLLWVPPLRAGLFQCDRSPSQARSFPGPMLLPCISPDAPQTSARASTREGTRPCGCKWVGKGGVLLLARGAPLVVLTTPSLPRLELSQVPICRCGAPVPPPSAWDHLPLPQALKMQNPLQISAQSPLLF